MTSLFVCLLRSSAMRYVALSGLSFWVNLGLTIGLTELLHLPEEVSFFLALVTVFVLNFFGMRYFVYDGRLIPVVTQFLSFLASSFGFRVLEYLAFLILHTWARLNYSVVVVVILAVSSVSKFFFIACAVFRSPHPPRPCVDTVGVQ